MTAPTPSTPSARVATSWPPLVSAERVPVRIRVRDALLTLAAWALLGYMLRNGLYLAWDFFRYPMFELTVARPPDWGELWVRIRFHALFIAILMLWLLSWGFARRATLAAVDPLPQPPALAPEEHARALRLPTDQVRALQAERIVVVSFDAEGHVATISPRYLLK